MSYDDLKRRAVEIIAAHRKMVLARQVHEAVEAPAAETWLHGKHVDQTVFTAETKAAAGRATTRVDFNKLVTEEVILELCHFARNKINPEDV